MNRSFKSQARQLSVRIFNEAPYFDYHQEGTSRIPARVMMAVAKTRERRIVEIIAADLNRKMQAA